ncbi:MAG: hypothetical protein ACXWC0_16480 [Burkholderiales bacterium]
MKRNDQVFQLSLTEIAFIIVFLLLLLLGWMVFQTERDRKALLEQAKKGADASAVIAAAERAKQDLRDLARKSGAVDQSGVISQLINREKLRADEAALRVRIHELDRTVSELTEVKEAIDGVKPNEQTGADSVRRDIATGLALTAAVRGSISEQPARDGSQPQDSLSRDQLLAEAKSALRLKGAVERQLGRKLQIGTETELAAELVSAAGKSVGHGHGQTLKSAERATKDLRGQVAFLKARLGSRGGRDYPPCWAEESSGRLQYLFTIDIRHDGLLLREAWPHTRDADAKLLPGLDELLARPPISVAEFNAAMSGIAQSSKTNNCRHYVLLRNHVKDLALFNTYRYAIENYFYKLEVRS